MDSAADSKIQPRLDRSGFRVGIRVSACMAPQRDCAMPAFLAIFERWRLWIRTRRGWKARTVCGSRGLRFWRADLHRSRKSGALWRMTRFWRYLRLRSPTWHSTWGSTRAMPGFFREPNFLLFLWSSGRGDPRAFRSRETSCAGRGTKSAIHELASSPEVRWAASARWITTAGTPPIRRRMP